MLPTATPRKMAADARTFLVDPPTLPVMSDRPRTKTALDEPVRSAWGGASAFHFGQN